MVPAFPLLLLLFERPPCCPVQQAPWVPSPCALHGPGHSPPWAPSWSLCLHASLVLGPSMACWTPPRERVLVGTSCCLSSVTGSPPPPGGGSRRLCSGPWRLNVSALFYGHFKFDMSKAIAPGICALPRGSWPHRPGPAGLTPDPGTAALDL